MELFYFILLQLGVDTPVPHLVEALDEVSQNHFKSAFLMDVGLFANNILQFLNAVSVVNIFWDLIDEDIDLLVKLHVLLQFAYGLLLLYHLHL